jgi:uncharacterized SAM-binding protein YcdF (DUF218 family)
MDPDINLRKLALERRWRHWRKLIWRGTLGMMALLIIWLNTIPFRLVIARYQYPTPQAILTLGGDDAREHYTAAFAQTHPNLNIWISTGMNPEDAIALFKGFDIDQNRLFLDRRAIDTVTNFTTLVGDFQSHHIHHLFLITSDYHMRRSKFVATIILGSQDIAFTPIAVPSVEPPESGLRIARDVARAYLWVITRRTAASLHPSQRRELFPAA